jgi:hypothetical protein
LFEKPQVLWCFSRTFQGNSVMSSTTSDGEKPKVASRRGHLRPEEAAKLIAAAGKRGRYPKP